MTTLDRILRWWRLRKVKPFLGRCCRLLDVGCGGGSLIRSTPHLVEYVGIDPSLPASRQEDKALFVKGWFPADLPDQKPFDAITMLAVLEHIPSDQQDALAKACYRLLNDDGYLLITMPSPFVDKILVVLTFLHLVADPSIEQHYGLETDRALALFKGCGLTLVKWKKFQLGLNNLLVFQKPSTDGAA
jgi:2-polyprenyl-3-methyl-5-hydroxy-6-metoxy-1,4-benzoquinol methylase